MGDQVWYKSRGVLGSIATVFLMIASFAGWVPPISDAGELTDYLLEMSVTVTALVSLVGRLWAKGPIVKPLA